jgi:hypothetical protein
MLVMVGQGPVGMLVTGGREGLLEKLMGGVRPEFCADLLTPAADDPVLGWKTCIVEGCGRPPAPGPVRIEKEGSGE